MKAKIKALIFLVGFAFGMSSGLFVGFKTAPEKQVINTKIGKVKSGKNSTGDMDTDTNIEIEQKQDKSRRKWKRRPSRENC